MAEREEQLLEQILAALERQERRASGEGRAAVAAPKAAAAAQESSLLVRGQQRLQAVAAGRAFGGGAAGIAAAGGLAAFGLAAKLAGAGLVAATQGGTFGGGVSRSLLGTVASIPIAGELLGASGAQRTLQGTEGDLNALTNQVARFAGAGAISPQVRGFLARTLRIQNENLELDRQANTAATNAELPNVRKEVGGQFTQMLGVLQKILEALTRSGAGGGAGAGGRR